MIKLAWAIIVALIGVYLINNLTYRALTAVMILLMVVSAWLSGSVFQLKGMCIMYLTITFIFATFVIVRVMQ